MTAPDVDTVRADALEVLAEHIAGLRGPTREPRARVALLDVEADAIVVSYTTPHPYGPEAGFRLRVEVEELPDPEPCQYVTIPGGPSPFDEPEYCGEDAALGSEFCRKHTEEAA